MITYYQYDTLGIYTQKVERTKFQPIPKPCTTVAPPYLTGTQVAQWNGSEWFVLDNLPIYSPPSPTKSEQQVKRQAAYAAEADPLFFKWRAGESTETDWLAKREEIRARYPYPE
jgi:hypothetical protein